MVVGIRRDVKDYWGMLVYLRREVEWGEGGGCNCMVSFWVRKLVEEERGKKRFSIVILENRRNDYVLFLYLFSLLLCF